MVYSVNITASHEVIQDTTTNGDTFPVTGGSRVAFLASGTEPVIRCFCEARSEG